ncbi:hypothetical protein Acr_23g0003970 [Actinidia rufa]|uniref:Oleosin n=1 Tax=Actinidia rufa TaxID=165716 RepID=A0A7J0GMJ7_9ERIC|nr:hypothetical protein Acr_23g0003970 [Actinidia rufa]
MAELRQPDQPRAAGPTKTQILAVVTGLPVGGGLLLLAGITLAGTLLSLAVTTPLFVIFSPILVPAGLTVALAVAGFLTSGAFGITALSSLSWIINNYVRRTRLPDHLEQAKRTAALKAKEMGQKTQESGRA